MLTCAPTAANIFPIAPTGIRPLRSGSTSTHASARPPLSSSVSHFLLQISAENDGDHAVAGLSRAVIRQLAVQIEND